MKLNFSDTKKRKKKINFQMVRQFICQNMAPAKINQSVSSGAR